MKDLLKFVKDFPVDVIPHMNEQEIAAYMKIKSLDQYQREALRSPQKHSSQTLSDPESRGALFAEEDTTKSPSI